MVSTRIQKTEYELEGGKVDAWEYVIRHLYKQEDAKWFRECHKSGGTLEEAIADAVASVSDNAEFYTVASPIDGEIAGFFIKTRHQGKLVLEGFHIGKAYRTPAFLEMYWDEVKRVFGETFFIGIYVGNERAIRHLLINGFDSIGTIEINGKKFNFLQYKLI